MAVLVMQAGDTESAGQADLQEREWVARCLSGETEAFDPLVERYYPGVYRLVRGMVSSPEAAEDLTQDALLRAFERLDRFDVERSFRNWLYAIASHLAIDWLRRQRLRQWDPLPWENPEVRNPPEWASDEPDPETVFLEQEGIRSIVRAISGLPARYRIVLLLRHVEECSLQQIAEILDLPLGTVKTRLFRGREQLINQLREQGVQIMER